MVVLDPGALVVKQFASDQVLEVVDVGLLGEADFLVDEGGLDLANHVEAAVDVLELWDVVHVEWFVWLTNGFGHDSTPQIFL